MPKNPLATAALALGVVVSGLVSALLLRGAVTDVLATGRVFSDFQVMLLAAKLAAGGDAAAAYDASRMLALEQGLSPGLNRVIHYSYPPTLALVLQPFLSLGPGVAQLAWTAVGGGILALAIAVATTGAGRRRSGCEWIGWVALLVGFPLACNIAGGQNGALFAGLLGLGLSQSARRPAVAGLCLALLTLKPHLCLVVPVALLAGRQWRTLAWTAAGTLTLAAASLWAFGVEAWIGFAAGLAGSGTRLSEGGFTAMRMATVFVAVYDGLGQGGAARVAALVAQAACGTAGLAMVARLWRREGGSAISVAVAVAAVPLTTPYLFDYDVVLYALPVATVVAREGRMTSAVALAYAGVLATAPWGMLVYTITGDRMNGAIAAHPLSFSCLVLSATLITTLWKRPESAERRRQQPADTAVAA